MAVLNVYAPHSVQERCELWEELVRTLPTDCRWILCGDWNVIESPHDKSSEEPRIISTRERFELDLLKVTLGVSQLSIPGTIKG